MFKSFAEILSKLTPAQRLFGLVLLLLSSLAIYLGPKLIVKNDCSDVLKIVEQQKKDILNLNQQIISVQTECTNSRIQRESEIAAAIADLEDEINRASSRKTRTLASVEHRTVEHTFSDSGSVMATAPPPPLEHSVVESRVDFSEINNKLNKVKSMMNR